jgi:hypothetical protein
MWPWIRIKTRYNTTRVIHFYTRLYGRWTYTKITIVPPFTNKYEKISTVIVFDASKILPGEEHRSRSVCLDKPLVLIVRCAPIGPSWFFPGRIRWANIGHLEQKQIPSFFSPGEYVEPILAVQTTQTPSFFFVDGGSSGLRWCSEHVTHACLADGKLTSHLTAPFFPSDKTNRGHYPARSLPSLSQSHPHLKIAAIMRWWPPLALVSK